MLGTNATQPNLDATEKGNEPARAPVPIIDRPIPLWRLVIVLALPVWGQKFLELAVQLSDRLLAGRFLEEGAQASQAAQTTAGYIYWFLNSFSVLVSVGGTALVARFIGAGDTRSARHATNQALVLAFLFGLVGGILGVVFSADFVELLGLAGRPAELTTNYLRPIFSALPFQMIELVGVACLIGAGDTAGGMFVLSGVAIVNLPLAWSLFLVWGFVGIAAGTAMSHVLGCIAVLVLLSRGRAGLYLRWADCRPDRPMMWRILRVSVPAGVDSLSVMLGQLCFLRIVNALGETASAAHGIALQWEALGYQTGSAFGIAAMALVGQNLGAGRPEQATRSGWTAFALGGGAMCVMGLIFFTLAEPMFRLFCPRPEQQGIVELGVPVLRLIAYAMPAVASWSILAPALRGAGDTRVPVWFGWFGFLCIRIPLAYYLTVYASWGLLGAWWAMIADLVVRGTAFVIRFYGGKWQLMRV
jgi:putative MATE family efflux protein